MYVAGHVPMLQGGCSSPSTERKKYAKLCMNSVRRNSMQNYLSFDKSGTFKVKKDGFYKVNGWLQMQAGQHFRIVNPIQTYSTHGNSNTKIYWRSHNLNFLFKFTKGQTFHFEFYAYSERGIGSYNEDPTKNQQEFQITYEGDDKKHFSGYCSSHGRGGWRVYCLNKNQFNSMGQDYMVPQSDGHLRVTKSGVYNFRTQVIQHYSGYGTTHSQILVNGGTRGYNYYLDQNWRDNIAQAYLQLSAGDDVYVKFHANNYAYHAGAYWSHMEFTFEEPLNLMDTSGGLTKRHGKETNQLNKLLETLKKKLEGELKAAELKTQEDGKVLKMKARAFEDAQSRQDQEDTDLEELKIRIASELKLIAKVKALVSNGIS